MALTFYNHIQAENLYAWDSKIDGEDETNKHDR